MSTSIFRATAHVRLLLASACQSPACVWRAPTNTSLRDDGRFRQHLGLRVSVAAGYRASPRAPPFPLPLLAEQKRIAAKVDELMKLCDELEANMRQAEETSQKVAEALVAELLT